MTNENRIVDMNKEQLLTLLTNFKELHKKIRPSSLDDPCSTIENEYISWYNLIKEINKLASIETFKNFHFSQEEEVLVADVLKIAKESKVTSRLTLAFQGIRIPA